MVRSELLMKSILKAGTVALALGTVVGANALTLELDAVISEASPNPVIKATIVDAGAGKVQITLDATGLNGFAGGKISDWAFNFDPSLDGTKFSQPSFLPLLSVGSAVAKNANLAAILEESVSLSPQSGFDLMFSWKTSNAGKFAVNEVLVYELAYNGPGSFNANSFNFANPGGYYSAVHIQGLPSSIKRGDADGGTGTPVPDGPTTAVLLSLGFLSLAAAKRRSRLSLK